MSSSFNSVDCFVIFIFAISILLGFFRGFLREVISLITWLAASAISTMFASRVAAMFGGASQNAGSAIEGASQGNYTNLVALAISFVVLFVGTLFVGYIVNIIITGILQGAFISLPNRLLGALFGAIRGFIVVVILMFVAELTPMGSQPAWGESHMVKAFQPYVSWLQNLVQPGIELIRSKAEGALQNMKADSPSLTNVQGILNGSGNSAPAGSP